MRNRILAATMAMKDISGKELSARAGISHVTLSRIVTGRAIPTQQTAEAIARVLGAKTSDLFTQTYKTRRHSK